MGTTTAALYVEGLVSSSFVATNESWNGTSWTELADINTARDQNTGGGVSTAALLTGGEGGPASTGATEIWDGSSWTEVGDMNTAKVQAGGSGISSLFLAYAGYNSVAATEEFDGVSWTEVADLSTGRSEMGYGSQGTQAACLATGGSTPSSVYYTNVEEWTMAQNIEVITD